MKACLSLAVLLLAASSFASGSTVIYDPPVDLRDQYAQHKARAAAGEIQSVSRVGYALLYGKGVEQDRWEGLKFTRMAAASGDVLALWRLEKLNNSGIAGRYTDVVVPVDEHKSKMYRDKHYAAIDRDVEDGSVSPMVAMSYARLHERGRNGIEENLERAKELYDLSIVKFESQGDVDALLQLAEIYTFGKAMRFEDKARGQAYMERALATGHPNAWYQYAEQIEDENEVESMRYLRKAAEAGHYRAMGSLEFSLPDSNDEKIRWNISRYEQQKRSNTAIILSRLYEQRGNQEEAIRWGLRALYNGNAYSLKSNLWSLYNDMIEFSGARDIDYVLSEAHEQAWDSILTSDAYAEFYTRGFEISGLCDKPISYSKVYCEAKNFMEGLEKPK